MSLSDHSRFLWAVRHGNKTHFHADMQTCSRCAGLWKLTWLNNIYDIYTTIWLNNMWAGLVITAQAVTDEVILSKGSAWSGQYSNHSPCLSRNTEQQSTVCEFQHFAFKLNVVLQCSGRFWLHLPKTQQVIVGLCPTQQVQLSCQHCASRPRLVWCHVVNSLWIMFVNKFTACFPRGCPCCTEGFYTFLQQLCPFLICNWSDFIIIIIMLNYVI